MNDARHRAPGIPPKAAGWYPHVGEVRPFDGGAETGGVRTRLSPHERSALLERELAAFLRHKGGRGAIETRSGFDAVVSIKPVVNHPLHALLSVLCAGLWLLVWFAVTVGATRSYRSVHVDVWGDVHWSGN